MSSKFESARIELAAVEHRSGEVLQSALASLWRRKRLVLGIAAIAVVLGIVAVLVMPARYTAEAYIRGGFDGAYAVTKTDDASSSGSISLDLVRVIETQSRWLQTQELARRVVQQLGLQRLTPDVGDSVDTRGDQDALAAAKLLRRLSVTSDSRAYLITVGYTSSDPDLAELVANTFVAEVLRSTKVQVLFQQRAVIQSKLLSQLSKFGEKHPKVAELRSQLVTINDALERQMKESPEAILLTAGENVTSAIAAPSSPHPLRVIGLFLLGGLLISIGVALFLERHRVSWAFFQRYAYDEFDGLDRSPTPSAPNPQ
jgi:uncharacterized protein involved in exopolysaccharide biosynthesis